MIPIAVILKIHMKVGVESMQNVARMEVVTAKLASKETHFWSVVVRHS